MKKDVHIFDAIHSALRSNNDAKALRLLMNSKKGELLPEFRPYSNHAWYIVGDIYSSRHQYERAIVYFKKSLRSCKTDIDAYLALGNSYSDLGRSREAAHVFSRGLSIRPRDSRLRYNLANAYFDCGLYDKATALYRSLTAIKRDDIGRLSRSNLKKICRLR